MEMLSIQRENFFVNFSEDFWNIFLNGNFIYTEIFFVYNNILEYHIWRFCFFFFERPIVLGKKYIFVIFIAYFLSILLRLISGYSFVTEIIYILHITYIPWNGPE